MIVDCAVYEEGCRRAGELELTAAVEAGRCTDAFVWIGLYEPTTEEFEAVRQEFALHDLAVEDAIRPTSGRSSRSTTSRCSSS